MFKLRWPGKKEAKPNWEFRRSNSLPLSREFSLENGDDPSVTFLDDTNIEIIISSSLSSSSSSNHIPILSHEQTPVVTSGSASPQDESRGVNNEITAPDLSSLKSQLYVYALSDMWHLAKPHIFDKFPDMVRIPLTARGDTALHVAVSARSTDFVEMLVFYLKMTTPEDLQIPNSDGMLPVHLAALTRQHNIVLFLSIPSLLDVMDSKDIERLFFMTISSNMFRVAMKLLQKYPTDLAVARDEEHLTALHILAQKPSEILNKEIVDNSTGVLSLEGLELVKKLWTRVTKLEYSKILELISEPSAVLFDLVKSGHVHAVQWLINNNRELVTISDPNNGRNLLHFAVLYRQSTIFFLLLDWPETLLILLRAVDNEGNHVLHFAAHLPIEFEAFSGLRASIQMQREVAWFKEIEKPVPPELRTMRNNMGKTPIDVFYDQHRKLSEEIKAAAKGIADSGMLVATLVATVAFAAALTVPGDKTSAWFIVFILTNAVALFASSASLLAFLSNFTSSRFAGSEFVISLHPSLTFGPVLLFISVVAMVVAFTAASFLIFDHTSKWVSYAVASMGVFPILLFLLFQFNCLDDRLWSRYYRLSNSKLD